jgi:hypothetical protein
MSGSEDVHAQTKSVNPTFSQQVITPDSPTYNYLTQVTVAAISVVYADNAAGGKRKKEGGRVFLASETLPF